jgi:hypothetical protein
MLPILLLSVLVPGCMIGNNNTPGTDHYYLTPQNNLSAVGKIAIVELYNDSHYPQIAVDTTQALFQALQKKQISSLTVVRQDDPTWRGLGLDSDGPYTIAQLAAISEALRCDAVLLGTVTQYQPYPHMILGLRLKLVDLRSGQLIWALEQIWDTADQTTEDRIREYFRRQMRSGYGPLREELVSISTIKFIRFVAYEVGETLPRG